MKKKIYLYLLIVMNVLSTSCGNSDKKYEYVVGLSTPPGYSAHIYSGSFQAPNGDMARMHQKIGAGHWGKTTSFYVIGSDMHSAPDKLYLCWFDPIENKFYDGKFDLSREKIIDYLEETCEYSFYKKTNQVVMKYNCLHVGILPGGEFVLWITGNHNSQVELGKYKAKEFDMAWGDFCQGCADRENYIKPFEKAREDIPYDFYEIHHIRHPWKFSVKLPSEGTVEILRWNMINGEKETWYDDAGNQDSIKERGTPYTLELYWYNQQGFQRNVRVLFSDNKELFDALYQQKRGVVRRPSQDEKIYQVLNKEIPSDEPAEILIDIKTEKYIEEDGVDVYVKTKDSTYNITPYINAYIFPEEDEDDDE